MAKPSTRSVKVSKDGVQLNSRTIKDPAI
ncbi:uncharacterized protein METZ01_LOCUS234434 [marine metagenome]|uniref:Uncharacterized protein n=1 Tax=marine metagenome TaxID=408172 RepID=A0A382H2T4_9ZZZZ